MPKTKHGKVPVLADVLSLKSVDSNPAAAVIREGQMLNSDATIPFSLPIRDSNSQPKQFVLSACVLKSKHKDN